MKIPEGMQVVTKREFFARLYADKRDIMPRSFRDHTIWEVVASRKPWGWSSHGWVGGRLPKQWAVADQS
jgi:hypothetical protein